MSPVVQGRVPLFPHFQKKPIENAELVLARLTVVRLKIPQTRNGIRDSVMKYGCKIRTELVSQIQAWIKSEGRFSLTLDLKAD